MSLPLYYDHCRGIGVDLSDKRSYLERYLEAKQLDADTYTPLAMIAFNLVQAQYRLYDMNQTVATDNGQRLAAQHAEVSGWENRAARYTAVKRSQARLFDQMRGDFITMATMARKPDEEESRIISLGLAGRIGEVVVEPVVEDYAWQDSRNAWDSVLNRPPSDSV